MPTAAWPCAEVCTPSFAPCSSQAPAPSAGRLLGGQTDLIGGAPKHFRPVAPTAAGRLLDEVWQTLIETAERGHISRQLRAELERQARRLSEAGFDTLSRTVNACVTDSPAYLTAAYAVRLARSHALNIEALTPVTVHGSAFLLHNVPATQAVIALSPGKLDPHSIPLPSLLTIGRIHGKIYSSQRGLAQIAWRPKS